MPELFGEILRYERIETGAAGAAVLSAVLLLGLLIARNVSSGKYTSIYTTYVVDDGRVSDVECNLLMNQMN